jgi:hypothetical protein
MASRLRFIERFSMAAGTDAYDPKLPKQRKIKAGCRDAIFYQSGGRLSLPALSKNLSPQDRAGKGSMVQLTITGFSNLVQ